jgi:hypothetical protein
MPALPLIIGGALAAAPWLMRGAPALGRGGKALWNLGKGLGSAGGRHRAGQAIWGKGSPGDPLRMVPGTPRGAIPRGYDWVGKNPIKSSLGLGAAGMLAPGLFAGDPEQPTSGGGVQLPGPQGAGPTAAVPFTSNLPSYTERAEGKRDKFMNNMSTIIKHSMLLSFQNPSRKNNYMRDSIGYLKEIAIQENEIEVARMIDEVFKDKKVPKTAKTIYHRMITAGASPKEAASVSGYTLEIEKSEAKVAADYARSQPKLSDFYSKDVITLMQLKDAYATNPQGAIDMLRYLLSVGQFDVPDDYKGYERKTDQDMYKLAAAILSGVGTAEVADAPGEVINIGLD